MTKGGVTARLDDTGHLWVLDPRGGNVREEPFGRIVDDTLLSPEPEHRWRARVHGDMIEFGPDDTSQIEGEVTPAVRHTALVMTAAFLIENAIAPR
jgi:hypothetical protein